MPNPPTPHDSSHHVHNAVEPFFSDLAHAPSCLHLSVDVSVSGYRPSHRPWEYTWRCLGEPHQCQPSTVIRKQAFPASSKDRDHLRRPGHERHGITMVWICRSQRQQRRREFRSPQRPRGIRTGDASHPGQRGKGKTETTPSAKPSAPNDLTAISTPRPFLPGPFFLFPATPASPLTFAPQVRPVACCPSRRGKEAQSRTTKQGLKTHVEMHSPVHICTVCSRLSSSKTRPCCPRFLMSLGTTFIPTRPERSPILPSLTPDARETETTT